MYTLYTDLVLDYYLLHHYCTVITEGFLETLFTVQLMYKKTDFERKNQQNEQ